MRGSFVSGVPDFQDVLDDDAECRKRSQDDADIGDHGIGHHAGDDQAAGRAADADAEIAEGVVQVHVTRPSGWGLEGSSVRAPVSRHW